MLRQGKPIETCIFNGDTLETTVHFGAFYNTHLVGVCSLYVNNNSNFNETLQYQLRGMAVLDAYQGRSIGYLLLKNALVFLQKKHIPVIWCNARSSAKHFYEKNGFSSIGSEFIIKEVGPHFTMYKKL